MKQFVLHPGAYSDLTEIWEYIAADNIEAADRVLDEIREAIKSLIRFPRQGHLRTDLSSRPLRFHVIRDYVVAYVPDGNPLTVIAILHGRRNPRVLAAIINDRS